MSTFSKEHNDYLKKEKIYKIKVHLTQILVIIGLFITWQILANKNIINTFLYSSPKLIIETIISLFKQNILFSHILITLYEVLLSFIIASSIAFIVSTMLWWNKFLSKVFAPFLTVINSLPKVALGPLIIIWAGANMNSIIIMSLLISVFITIINLYESFISTNKNYIILLKSLGATKKDIFQKVIIKSNTTNIISALKINLSMNFIGVVMGELLVSKKGLGYLIMYASSIFNINLIITAIIILGLLSVFLYSIFSYIEKNYFKK